MTITNPTSRRFVRSREERAATKAAAQAVAAEAATRTEQARIALDSVRRADRQRLEDETAARKAERRENRRAEHPIEDRLTMVAATIATIAAGQGMWSFLEQVLPNVHWVLRGLMFAIVEIAVVISALRARRNIREERPAGVDGLAVWVLTGVSAVLAATEAHSPEEVLFRLAAPLIAAWLWERGMSIERARLTGKSRINWRWTPEKILVRIGVAEPTERTAGEVDAQRRLTKVAILADRVADADPNSRTHKRLTKALKRRGRQMVARTDVASDEAQREFLLRQIGVARAIGTLPTAGGRVPWEPTEVVPGPVTEVVVPPVTPKALEVTALVTGGATTPALPDATEPVAEVVTEPVTDAVTPAVTSSDHSGDRPGDQGSDQDGDRDRPDERDNKTAEVWVRIKCRGKNGVGTRPSQREVGRKFGFSDGWGRDRVQAVQSRMIAQGYVFLEDSRVYAPGVALPEDQEDRPIASSLTDLGDSAEKPNIHLANGAELS